MSVGFRPFSPVPQFKERIYWRVRKGSRTAEARVRVLPIGLELRVLVGSDLVWSRLYRQGEDYRALGQMSEGCRIDFERLGWQRDTEVWARWPCTARTDPIRSF